MHYYLYLLVVGVPNKADWNASGSPNYLGLDVPSNAIDGVIGTLWQPGDNILYWGWLQVDFGFEWEVTSVGVTTGKATVPARIDQVEVSWSFMLYKYIHTMYS